MCEKKVLNVHKTSIQSGIMHTKCMPNCSFGTGLVMYLFKRVIVDTLQSDATSKYGLMEGKRHLGTSVCVFLRIDRYRWNNQQSLPSLSPPEPVNSTKPVSR